MARYCVGPSMEVDWGDGARDRGWDRGTARRIAGYFRPYVGRTLLALACVAVLAVLGLVPAVVTKALIDHLADSDAGFGRIVFLVEIGLGAALATGLVGVAQDYLTSNVSQGIMHDLRTQLFERVLGQTVRFFTAARSGEVMSRVTNDVNRVEDVLSDTVVGFVASVAGAVTTAALMFALDWRLALAALAILPVAVVPTRRVGRSSFRAQLRVQEQLGRMTAYLQERLGISGAFLVKAFGRRRAESAAFADLSSELQRRSVRLHMVGSWFAMLLTVLQNVAPAILWLYGGYLAVRGQTSVGTVVTFTTVLVWRLYGAAGEIGSMHVNLTGSFALFQRIFEYLDLEPEIRDARGARRLESPRGELEFDDVTFSYGDGLRPALDGVSFRVEPGQLVALVGPTGAGKSTATYLVPRFYDPQSGRVLLDGHDVRELTLDSLGEHIGVVFQETFLFHATIRENLLYARPDASDADVVAAAKAACVHDTIVSLPDGYDTLVGERGYRLSGGQKQCIAIARVLLKDPRILILDEATSHLDTVSEQMVQAAMEPLLHGRTALVIAHRLSTILSADLIVVLDRGRLVERGTHAELLDLKGLYARLYERQFRVPHAAPVAGAGAQRPSDAGTT